MRASSHLTRSASKAPCTSIMIIVVCKPAAIADSKSWVKAATRSIAERFGRAPPCWGERMPQVRAVQAIRLAMVRSRPFEIHKSSAIGL